MKHRGLLLVLCGVGGMPLVGQSTSLVFRGEVRDEGGARLSGVIVHITGRESGLTRSTTTNNDGVYVVVVADRETQVVLTARAFGFTPTSRTIGVSADQRVITIPLMMVAAPYALEPIVIPSGRGAPTRPFAHSLVGTHDRDLLQQRLFTLDRGDFSALAGRLSGVMRTDSGFSVLGLGADQNRIDVDGSFFGGSGLPADAVGSARFATSMHDPSRGDFSGGLISVTTLGGTRYFEGAIRGGRAPSLLSHARRDAVTGTPTRGSLNGYLSGPLPARWGYYRFTWDMQQVTTPIRNIVSSARVATARGIGADTLAALTTTLDDIGITNATAVPPVDATILRGALRLDLPLLSRGTFQLLGSTSQTSMDRIEGDPAMALSSHRSTAEARSLRFQASGSLYLGGLLSSFSLAIDEQRQATQPEINQPRGSLDLGVTTSDGRAGIATLLFGGAGSRGLSWHRRIDFQSRWILVGSQHTAELALQGRVNMVEDRRDPDPLGHYTYRSLDALRRGEPTGFRRALVDRPRAGRQVAASMSLGDTWIPGPGVRMQGGLRLAGARPLSRPEPNAALYELFALRTEHVPSRLTLSPRLGFRWNHQPSGDSTVVPVGCSRDPATGAVVSDSVCQRPIPTLRVSQLIAALADANQQPGITFDVGGGAYYGEAQPSAGLLATLIGENGLASGTSMLACAGAGSPAIDWGRPALPATYCADGSGPTVATIRPRARAYDPAYRDPVTWRVNLLVAGLRSTHWTLGVGISHHHSRQTGWVNDNVPRTPAFSLVGETGRPVLVAPTEIDPTSGSLLPGARRVSTAFDDIRRVTADQRADITEIAALLSPRGHLFSEHGLTGFWVLTLGHQTTQGFGGTTAGDPFQLQRTPLALPRHRGGIEGSLRLWRLTVDGVLRIESGQRYTPVVAGDVNGDGLSGNDRAFIPDPASGTTLAEELRALQATLPTGARDCIVRQVGVIAGAFSCASPWRVDLDLRLALPVGSSLRLGNRLTIGVEMLGAGELLKRLMGLEPEGGFGSGATRDTRLLRVAGFDPEAQAFQYRVNPRFGQRVPRGAYDPIGQPVQIFVGAQLKLGADPQYRMVRAMGLHPTGGEKSLPEAIASERLRASLADPLAGMRDEQRNRLSSAQVAALDSLQQRFQAELGELLQPVALAVTIYGRRLTDGVLATQMAGLRAPIERLQERYLALGLMVLASSSREE